MLLHSSYLNLLDILVVYFSKAAEYASKVKLIPKAIINIQILDDTDFKMQLFVTWAVGNSTVFSHYDDDNVINKILVHVIIFYV